MRKTVIWNVRLFSTNFSSTSFQGAIYLPTLILSSWRLRKISCIVLYCSFLWDIRLYFCWNKWANDLHNANSARPHGLTKFYYRLEELSTLITPQLKTIPEWKVGRFEGRLIICMARNSKLTFSEESVICKASLVQFLQICDARRLARKIYVVDHWSNAVSSCHKAFAAVYVQVQSVQNNVSSLRYANCFAQLLYFQRYNFSKLQ